MGVVRNSLVLSGCFSSKGFLRKGGRGGECFLSGRVYNWVSSDKVVIRILSEERGVFLRLWNVIRS